MRRGPLSVFALLCLSAVALVLILGYLWLETGDGKGGVISLPPSATISIYHSSEPAPNSSALPAEVLAVNAETLKTVLSTLEQAQGYSAYYRTTWFFNGGENSRSTGVFAKGGFTRIIAYGNSMQPLENYLTDGTRMFIWDEGAQAVVSLSMGDRSIDDTAYIPSYSAIFAMEQSEIIAASYEMIDEAPCITAETKSGAYTVKWRISLSTALLDKAEMLENGAPVITVEMTPGYSPEPPADGLFILPDGRALEEWLADTQDAPTPLEEAKAP